MPGVTLNHPRLTEEWQTFSVPIQAFSVPLDLDDERLAAVVGPFGWTISWSANGVSDQRRTFVIEVRNIIYAES
jgi:hypothetical protein